MNSTYAADATSAVYDIYFSSHGYGDTIDSRYDNNWQETQDYIDAQPEGHNPWWVHASFMWTPQAWNGEWAADPATVGPSPVCLGKSYPYLGDGSTGIVSYQGIPYTENDFIQDGWYLGCSDTNDEGAFSTSITTGAFTCLMGTPENYGDPSVTISGNTVNATPSPKYKGCFVTASQLTAHGISMVAGRYYTFDMHEVNDVLYMGISSTAISSQQEYGSAELTHAFVSNEINVYPAGNLGTYPIYIAGMGGELNATQTRMYDQAYITGVQYHFEIAGTWGTYVRQAPTSGSNRAIGSAGQVGGIGFYCNLPNSIRYGADANSFYVDENQYYGCFVQQ